MVSSTTKKKIHVAVQTNYPFINGHCIFFNTKKGNSFTLAKWNTLYITDCSKQGAEWCIDLYFQEIVLSFEPHLNHWYPRMHSRHLLRIHSVLLLPRFIHSYQSQTMSECIILGYNEQVNQIRPREQAGKLKCLRFYTRYPWILP